MALFFEHWQRSFLHLSNRTDEKSVSASVLTEDPRIGFDAELKHRNGEFGNPKRSPKQPLINVSKFGEPKKRSFF